MAEEEDMAADTAESRRIRSAAAAIAATTSGGHCSKAGKSLGIGEKVAALSKDAKNYAHAHALARIGF